MAILIAAILLAAGQKHQGTSQKFRFIREFREKRPLHVEPAVPIGGVQGHAGLFPVPLGHAHAWL
jgi:hypothetical protein